MSKIFNRTLSMLLAVVMLFGVMPTTGFAEDEIIIAEDEEIIYADSDEYIFDEDYEDEYFSVFEEEEYLEDEAAPCCDGDDEIEEESEEESEDITLDSNKVVTKKAYTGFSWFWPAGYNGKPNNMSSTYGYRYCSFHGKELHNGIDITQGKSDKYVHAAADGTVVKAVNSNGKTGYGTYVVIKHSNPYGDGVVYYTLYGHMAYNSLKVAKNSKVSKGDIIGTIGSTGSSEGKHIHFNIYKGAYDSKHIVNTNPKYFNGVDISSATKNKTINGFYVPGNRPASTRSGYIHSSPTAWTIAYTNTICKHTIDADGNCTKCKEYHEHQYDENDTCTGTDCTKDFAECRYNYYEANKTPVTGEVVSKISGELFHAYNGPTESSGYLRQVRIDEDAGESQIELAELDENIGESEIEPVEPSENTGESEIEPVEPSENTGESEIEPVEPDQNTEENEIGPELLLKKANVKYFGKNHLGQKWYEVEVFNNAEKVTGYVQASDISDDGINNTVTFKGLTYPKGLKAKSSFTPAGTITSSALKIEKVTAAIYLVKTGKLYSKTGGTFTKSVSSIKKTSYKLGSDFSKLSFKMLSGGYWYDYAVTVTLENGSQRTEVRRFYVAKNSKTVNKKVLIFHANGGYGGPGSYTNDTGNTALNAVDEDEIITVNLDELETPVRYGFNFLGWATDEDADTPDVSGVFSTTEDETDFYAVWEAIGEPSAPDVEAQTYDVGIGRAASISWTASKDAASYTVTAYNEAGDEVFSQKTSGTFTSVMFDEAGTYLISISAANALDEESEETEKLITVNVHPDVTVTFNNYDGTVWTAYTVKYGESAAQPTSPTREGYTFNGWDKSFLKVTEDCVIEPIFSAIPYKVTFYNADGSVLSEQNVTYNGDTPGSAADPAAEVTVPTGYTFIGWDNNDWNNVTRDGVEVRPAYVWANADMPITATINSLTKSGDGYWIDYSITNMVAASKLGRVIVTLRTAQGQLLTTTESGAFYLTASGSDGGSYNGTMYIPLDAEKDDDFYLAELYVVNDFKEMTPISEPVHREKASQGSGIWSKWMTQDELNAVTYNYSSVESKTQYRYQKMETTTATTSVYSDWTRDDTKTTYITSDWSDWVDWDTVSQITDPNIETETQEVVTKAAEKQYRYGAFTNGTYTDWNNVVSGYTTKKYTPWITYQYNKYDSFRSSKRGTNYYKEDGSGKTTYYKTVTESGTVYYYWMGYYHPNSSGWNKSKAYWWEENRTVPAETETQYRYRTNTPVYTFWHWTNWSAWSDQAVTADDNTKVQTQTLYRVFIEDENEITYSGEHQFSGSLGSAAANKQAILSVYKYTQASDYTNEFIQQITLGDDGSYSVSFDLMEEPTVESGDYTVALTVAGSANPVYIGTIEAAKRMYVVKLVDEVTGDIIATYEDVAEGSAITAPTVPTHEGYIFLGWEYGLSNIREDMLIRARYVPREYVVVYIDWVNGTANMVTGLTYGSELVLPNVKANAAYTFLGWKAPGGTAGESIAVTDNMIVTAEYAPVTYSVQFTDAGDNVISTVDVQYGKLPVDPLNEYYIKNEDDAFVEDEDDELDLILMSDEEAAEEDDSSVLDEMLNIPEGMYFDGWNDAAYSPATQNAVIAPIYLWSEDADEPQVSLEPGVYEGAQTLTLSCEDDTAVLTYKINRLDSTAEGEEITYTAGDVITLTNSCILEVKVSAESKNDITASYEYTIVAANSYPAAPANLTAVNTEEGITLSWSAASSVDGYMLYRTDGAGSETMMTADGTSYTDTDVEGMMTYTYQVASYRLYTADGSGLFLESKEKTAPQTIKYFGESKAVTAITLSAPDTIYVGTTTQVSAVVTPADAYDTEVSWGIANNGTGSAYVTEDGLLVAGKEGTVTLCALATDGSDTMATKEITIVTPSGNEVTLSIGSAQIKKGETKTVSVSISENSLAETIQFALLYDASKVQLTGCTAGSVMADKAPTINSGEPGVVYFVWESTAALTAGGSLIDLSFAPVEGVKKGEVVLSIPTNSDEYDFILTDGTLTSLDVVNTSGVIEIRAVKYGDVDGNNSINVIDANLIRRYAAKLIDLTSDQLESADVNGDGKVNVLDANLIRRYVAKLITTFPAEA